MPVTEVEKVPVKFQKCPWKKTRNVAREKDKHARDKKREILPVTVKKSPWHIRKYARDTMKIARDISNIFH